MSSSFTKKGFTLPELLIVISVVSVLISVSVYLVGHAGQKSRDADRKGDLQTIQLALAQYQKKYGIYPPTVVGVNCGGVDGEWADSAGGTCGGHWLTSDPKFYVFLPQVPLDPLNTGFNASFGDGNYVYTYAQSQGGADYELIAQLEASDSSDCEHAGWKIHQISSTEGEPWCAPWPRNAGRSKHIYSDHM